MNLHFDVLWFDDDPNFLDSLDLEPFQEKVLSWGFQPQISFVNSPAEFNRKNPDNYDLIVVDYNLGEHEQGQDFIKRIRDNRAYTEIIFYSANPASDLWDAIKTKQLEGVFVANKQVILDKLERVAHQSVHKVLDLNNMRGMVMAEVGDIDHLLDSILKIGVPGLKKEDQAKFFNGIHERGSDQAEKISQALKEFKDKPTTELMARFFDSYKRWLAFKGLIKRHPSCKDLTLQDFNNDVLNPRNFLAHGIPEETDQGHLFRYNGKEYLFDEAKSLALRKKILEYKELFQSIHDKLSAAAAAA